MEWTVFWNLKLADKVTSMLPVSRVSIPCPLFVPLAVPPTLSLIVIGRLVHESEGILRYTQAPSSGLVPPPPSPRGRRNSPALTAFLPKRKELPVWRPAIK